MSSKPVKLDVPGPTPTDEKNGNIPDIGAAGSLHQYLVKLHQQFGPIASLWYKDTQVVSVADPEIFQQQTDMLTRPMEIYTAYKPLLGEQSIFYASDSEVSDRRDAYHKCFTADRIDVYSPVFQTAAKEIVAKWKSMKGDEHVNLNTDMATFALKVVLDTFFGDHFENEDEVVAFEKAYDVCWSEMEKRIVEDAPPRGSDRDLEFEEAIATMKSIIKSAAMTREMTITEGGQELLIDVMIEQSPDEDHLFADSLTYAVGGYHTIANLLTWCLYFLAANPKVQSNVYTEIGRVLGEAGNVSTDNATKLKYLMQVIQETMRCAVIAPWTCRFDRKDGEVGGYQIPKYTPVIQALGVVLQDAKYWSDPERFSPDRFNKDNVAARPSFVFQPFGFAGCRKCPFDTFTYVEATVCIVSILREFELRLVPGQEVGRVYGLVTHPSIGIKLIVKQR